jgi:uncharacterized protein YraI
VAHPVHNQGPSPNDQHNSFLAVSPRESLAGGIPPSATPKLSIPLGLEPVGLKKRRWRFVMKLRTALLALLTTALFAASVHAQMLRVTIRKAPIRSGPGSQEPLVTTAMEGDMLEYVDTEGLYYIVRVPGTQQVGYVHSALVKQTAQQTRPAQRAPAATQPAPMNPPPATTRPANPNDGPPPPPPRRTRRTPTTTSSTTNESGQLPNTQPAVDPSGMDNAPWEHRGFGIGMRVGHNTIGSMAFNMRTFGDTLGLSFDLASELDVLQMQPSLMFKIGDPIETKEVYFQPYFGVGGNTFWDRINDDFKFGVVALGGADVGFSAVPQLTVSLDLGYFSDPIDGDCGSDCFTSNFSDRLGLNFGVNWYFK